MHVYEVSKQLATSDPSDDVQQSAYSDFQKDVKQPSSLDTPVQLPPPAPQDFLASTTFGQPSLLHHHQYSLKKPLLLILCASE